MIPEDLGYSDQHEWVRSGEDVVRIGITDYAQNALGDIVFVQLPEVGSVVTAGDAIGEVESTKSVSEIFTPLSGTVVAVNDDLESARRSWSTPTPTATAGSTSWNPRIRRRWQNCSTPTATPRSSATTEPAPRASAGGRTHRRSVGRATIG